MDAPQIEVIYNENQKQDTSHLVPHEKRALETHLKKPKPKTHKKKSHSSTSDDNDGDTSFREIADASNSIIKQFQDGINALDAYKEEREKKDSTIKSLFEKNTQDNLDILKRIKSFDEKEKNLIEFNTQSRDDMGLLKKRMDSIETLYKILNDGLTAKQQSADLEQSTKPDEKQSAKFGEKFDAMVLSNKQFITESQKLLEKIQKSSISMETHEQKIKKIEGDCENKIKSLENNYLSLERRVQKFMLGSAFILLTSLCIWLHNYKKA